MMIERAWARSRISVFRRALISARAFNRYNQRVPFRWVAEELFWFLSGDTNEANLRARGVDIWAEWADEDHTQRFGRTAGDLGPVYGYLWRSFGGSYPQRDGVDQIARLIEQIEKAQFASIGCHRMGPSPGRQRGFTSLSHAVSV